VGADLNGDAHEMYHSLFGPNVPQFPQRPLAVTSVEFVGDPVAIVVADMPHIIVSRHA